MKKKVFAVILAAAAICGSLSPVYAADSELVLYTWEGMFPQEVLDGFEEETGCKIVYSNFDTDETMLEKVSMAKGGDYDVVIADDYILEKIVEEGLATKLDKDKISNWGNINPLYQGQFYDAKDEYTVPYGAFPDLIYGASVCAKVYCTVKSNPKRAESHGTGCIRRKPFCAYPPWA